MRSSAMSRSLIVFLLPLACAEGPRSAVGGGGADAERAGGVAVVCANSLPDALDPFVSPDIIAADLRLLLFTPLVLFDSAGDLRPYLATDWEWEDEQRQLRLRLRGDVRWHDGQLVTAEDVAWTVLAAADSTYAYPSGDFSGVRDAVVRDSTTIEVLFHEPFTAGLEPFTQLPILPRHLLAGVAADAFARDPYHRAPVGSGPFRFAGRTADGALQFDRFADFPEALGRPLLDRVVLRGVPEASSIMIELQTGNIDLCVTGSSLARDVTNTPGLSAVPLPPSGVQVIQLSTGVQPFTDARVRRAFSAALRRADLAASTSPLVRPARTYLPAGSERWADSTLLQPDANPVLAAALLDSAGWSTLGTDGVRRNAAGEPLRFTIVAPPPLSSLLTVIQSQLREVGMQAELRFMEGAAFVGTIRNPAARPAAMALSLVPDRFVLPDPSGQLHSRGGANFTGYADPGTDSLLARLEQVIPAEERGAIYHELQRRVAEQAPLIYTLYFPRLLAVGSRLEDVQSDLNGAFTSVTRWWIPPDERRRGSPAATPPDSVPEGS